MNSHRFPTTRSRQRLIQAVWLSLMLSGSAAAVSSDGLTVRLLPEVQVGASAVRLSQIAKISGPADQAAVMGELVVIESAAGGEDFEVRAWKVSELLSSVGYDLTRVAIRGSAVCRVQTAAAASSEGPQRSQSSGLSLGAAANVGGPASLESRIRKVICDQLVDLPEDAKVKIDFNPTVGPVLSLTDPPYSFRIEPQGDVRRLGLIGLKVEIVREAEVLQTVQVLAKVEVEAPLLVARRTINSKAEIGEPDVELLWRPIRKVGETYVTALDEVSGQRARRLIPPGTVITADLLEAQPMASRGQLVTVLHRVGGLEVRMTGRAMSGGVKGELISVRNERSKDIFRGRLIKPGVVLVETAPLQSGPELVDGSEVIRP